MSKSKAKKRSVKSLKSPFAAKALKAMRQAQRTAAREDARYGLPLLVESAPSKSHSGGGKSKARAQAAPEQRKAAANITK